MKYKLVLTSMVLGAIVCSTSAVVGATDVAPQVSDTTKHDAVQSNWMDRTDIAVGVQTGGQSKLDKGHFLTDDLDTIYNKKSDYGNLTKAYIETLQPISHYDENSKSVLFVQGRIGRGGEKIVSKEMRGYFLPEIIINRNGQPSYTVKNTDEKSSETLGIIGTVGIGYRRLSRNEHAYVGVNAFVDRAFTGNYNRISGGVEYVNGLNEVYANVYKGLGNTGVVRGFGGNPYPKRLYPNGYPSTFPYNTIPSENYNTYKGGRALGGYEIGFARSFKNARWARAYVNGYRWKGHGFGHEQEYNYGRPGHWSVPWFSVRNANHYKGILERAVVIVSSLCLPPQKANLDVPNVYLTVPYIPFDILFALLYPISKDICGVNCNSAPILMPL